MFYTVMCKFISTGSDKEVIDELHSPFPLQSFFSLSSWRDRDVNYSHFSLFCDFTGKYSLFCLWKICCPVTESGGRLAESSSTKCQPNAQSGHEQHSSVQEHGFHITHKPHLIFLHVVKQNSGSFQTAAPYQKRLP